jgi:hypothetical protein
MNRSARGAVLIDRRKIVLKVAMLWKKNDRGADKFWIDLRAREVKAE